MAERAHSSRTGGASLSQDTVWWRQATNVNIDVEEVPKARIGGPLYPSQAGGGKQLVHSDQKLPQQILQLLVKLQPVLHRKLLLSGRRMGDVNVECDQRKAGGELEALALKNCSRSAASVSSVRTSKWKFSTVL